jgi:hypothetical protein
MLLSSGCHGSKSKERKLVFVAHGGRQSVSGLGGVPFIINEISLCAKGILPPTDALNPTWDVHAVQNEHRNQMICTAPEVMRSRRPTLANTSVFRQATEGDSWNFSRIEQSAVVRSARHGTKIKVHFFLCWPCWGSVEIHLNLCCSFC